VLFAPLCAAAVLTGCGSDSGSGGSSGSIAVRAGDDSCEADRTALDAGKVSFKVKNVGGDVTEVYVYAKDDSGSYKKIVGEVENIAPQTSRDFPVTLSAGDYELACKPGQTGDGIRTKLTVTGAAAAAPSESASSAAFDREVEIETEDFKFEGLEGFTAKAGERIKFELKNHSATHQHEFEVFGPDGTAVGEVEPVDPGEDGEAIIEFKTSGTYRFECGIEDHAQRGMKGTFTVTAS
jgi:uncharacterized cupredoxin-like copper-binding protein